MTPLSALLAAVVARQAFLRSPVQRDGRRSRNTYLRALQDFLTAPDGGDLDLGLLQAQAGVPAGVSAEDCLVGLLCGVAVMGMDGAGSSAAPGSKKEKDDRAAQLRLALHTIRVVLWRREELLLEPAVAVAGAETVLVSRAERIAQKTPPVFSALVYMLLTSPLVSEPTVDGLVAVVESAERGAVGPQGITNLLLAVITAAADGGEGEGAVEDLLEKVAQEVGSRGVEARWDYSPSLLRQFGAPPPSLAGSPAADAAARITHRASAALAAATLRPYLADGALTVVYAAGGLTSRIAHWQRAGGAVSPVLLEGCIGSAGAAFMVVASMVGESVVGEGDEFLGLVVGRFVDLLRELAVAVGNDKSGRDLVAEMMIGLVCAAKLAGRSWVATRMGEMVRSVRDTGTGLVGGGGDGLETTIEFLVSYLSEFATPFVIPPADSGRRPSENAVEGIEYLQALKQSDSDDKGGSLSSPDALSTFMATLSLNLPSEQATIREKATSLLTSASESDIAGWTESLGFAIEAAALAGNSTAADSLFQLLKFVVGQHSVNKMNEPRVSLVLAVGRTISRGAELTGLVPDSAGELDLGQMLPLGKFVLRALHSSVRELRVGAITAVGRFVDPALGQVAATNREVVEEYLAMLEERAGTGGSAERDGKVGVGILEAVVMGWGAVVGAGRAEMAKFEGMVRTSEGVPDSSELLRAEESVVNGLVQICRLLGSRNPFVSAAAAVELAQLGESAQQGGDRAGERNPVDALLAPLMADVLPLLLQAIGREPDPEGAFDDIFYRLAGLLGRPVDELIASCQAECVPLLVATGATGMLERFAASKERVSGTRTTVRDVCLRPARVLGGVLAEVLVRMIGRQGGGGGASPDFDAVSAECVSMFAAVASEFGSLSLGEMVRIEYSSTASELLKRIAVAEDSQAPLQALALTAALALEKRPAPLPSTKVERTIVSFFGSHLLGLVASFSHVLGALPGTHSMRARRVAIGAIGELVRLANGRVGDAIPQIRASVEAAVEAGLVSEGVGVWLGLVRWFADENAGQDSAELPALTEHTFALVAEQWPRLDEKTVSAVHALLLDLIDRHQPLLQARAGRLARLPATPLLSKIAGDLAKYAAPRDIPAQLADFVDRVGDESVVVTQRGLLELAEWLRADQHASWIGTAVSNSGGPVVARLVRALLDAPQRFSSSHRQRAIASAAALALGRVGAVDGRRVPAAVSKSDPIVVSNFGDREESIAFVAAILEEVLVRVFRSAGNGRAQNYVAFTMQELMRWSGFAEAVCGDRVERPRARDREDPASRAWRAMAESTRTTLAPYLHSRFFLQAPASTAGPIQYPVFGGRVGYAVWLRTVTRDLMGRSALAGAEGPATSLFAIIARVIRWQDSSIAAFVLPYAAVDGILHGAAEDVVTEIRAVLSAADAGSDEARKCGAQVFLLLDYLSRWRLERVLRFGEADEGVHKVGAVLASVSPEMIAERAMGWGEGARALFYWERAAEAREREREKSERAAGKTTAADPASLEWLQTAYSQLDEPDCLEGVFAKLRTLSPEQRALADKQAGRWGAVQAWAEMALHEPGQPDRTMDLLSALRNTGQHGMVLSRARAILADRKSLLLPQPVRALAVEAAWATADWDTLSELVSGAPADFDPKTEYDFLVSVGRLLSSIRNQSQPADVASSIEALRSATAASLSPTNTVSVEACSDQLWRLQVLSEIERVLNGNSVAGAAPTSASVSPAPPSSTSSPPLLTAPVPSLPALPPQLHLPLLTLRFGALAASRAPPAILADSLLASARLARKAGLLETAYGLVLQASALDSAKAAIELAKGFWARGAARQAIAVLTHYEPSADSAAPACDRARAALLLAKWMDRSGSTHADAVIDQYQRANGHFARWEKGHFHLGKYYNKQLETEKTLPVAEQSAAFQSGEHARLVIANYWKSAMFGVKHTFETIPRILTLWLDLAALVHADGPEPKPGSVAAGRAGMIAKVNSFIVKYHNTIAPFVLYSALSQLLSRVGMPNKEVGRVATSLIGRVVRAHPEQALWSVLAVAKSSVAEKRAHVRDIVDLLKRTSLVRPLLQASKLTDALVSVCDTPVTARSSTISLSKNLLFDHALAPSFLAVPVASALTPNLPTTTIPPGQSLTQFSPFQTALTIASFDDQVLVLSSLQRPRKISLRGSDGRPYALLCKPKDDLRLDQRTMEFNSLINRALHHSPPAYSRSLSIRTNAITPLNESCGAIEWVDGVRPLRDIILKLYHRRGKQFNFAEVKVLLDTACSSPAQNHVFTDEILPQFPPVLSEFFVDTFPSPQPWLSARLLFARSCAIMSIVGHVIGLGDRHGENVLLHVPSGTVVHVDFNCLFDKGLTFDKPELVPFRLTHNMVHAFGPTGVDGPFRRAAEAVTEVVRAEEAALLAVLETFVHDPTTGLAPPASAADRRNRRKKVPGVPSTAAEVLESVRNKVRGRMRGEAVPLGVDGWVDQLIRRAVDEGRLAGMYIGWCPFF